MSEIPAARSWWQSLLFQIFLAMLLGGVTGWLLGSGAAALGALGKLVIQLIKALAIPLVFFAISEGILSTHIPRRSVGRLFLIVGMNATAAISIALVLANLFRPGDALRAVATDGLRPLDPVAPNKALGLSSMLSGFVPESVLAPIMENNVGGTVLLAILIGLAGRALDEGERERLRSFLCLFLKLFERILSWLVHLVPLAVFGVTAKTVGEYGFAPLGGLAQYVAVCAAGLFLQVVLVYQSWIVLYSRRSLRAFWREARPAVAYALGTNSSLATLPMTLGTLERMSVGKAASRLGACVGTNLNNDGILLYEAVAALIVAQALGIELSLAQQLSICVLCVLAAIGVAGIPEAGIISLSLVLTAVGLPTELLPLLLTVDWVVARLRSAVNVLSDMTVSIVLHEAEERS